MLDWIKKIIVNKYVASLIRHALTIVAGWLAAIGLSEELIHQFTVANFEVLLAVALWLVAQGWSLLEKKNR